MQSFKDQSSSKTSSLPAVTKVGELPLLHISTSSLPDKKRT